ncbi:alginate export family protein [Methylophaga pinxianii]|uniref:alginate export family protein n=1 Tax=Methylophaga pinxianii TaxID=2881052 RepID=UPI001CF49E2C|nr:alginate export family protein [Methylophaga pinxianii]MCB2426432.1 alginate export family protein [Methylophaga pinxianii]UPH45003.1 alginate export family protein [Methylophaga pinxianii]
MEYSRPSFEKFRFDESYNYRNAPVRPSSLFYTIKHIPLTSNRENYLNIGGSIRERYEYTNDPVFGDVTQDEDGVWLQRVNLHADMQLGRHLRLFGELTSALSEGRANGPSPVDENRLDLQNAFADFSFGLNESTDLTIRAGRQEIEFGSGRLVDVREGTNVRRTFDGFRGLSNFLNWDVSAVAVRPRRDKAGVFDDETNHDESMWGLYTVGRPDFLPEGSADFYYLGFRDDIGSFVQGVNKETRHTVGMRLWGAARGWDWNWETVYQFGSFGDDKINAWTLASDTGFTFSTAPLQPRVGLRANIASGDKDPTDSTLQTFNPLFPRGNYFSQAAVLGPRNFFNFNPHLNLQLTDKLSLNTDVNFYWRLERNDGVYSPSGQIIRGPGDSNARYVATGLSFELAWAPINHLDFTVIYTHLQPGPFIRQTGDSKDMDFLEITARFRF